LTFVCGPRMRNSLATRAALLDAAIRRFTRDGYDDVGMRDVAGDVGIDAALVVRYFGSKEQLFEAALDACFDGDDLWDGDRSTFGARIAEQLVDRGQDAEKLHGLLIILRSMGSAKAMDVIQTSCMRDFIGPLTGWLGGEDAPVRARLLAGFIMGMSISREITSSGALSDDHCRQLRDRLAATLQSLVDGPA
jgi:AcrR family transcriptional regulator